MAQRRISIVFIVAAATLALSVAVVWRTVHGRSSEAPPYVGRWKFISGQVTAPNVELGGKGKPGAPLAGKSAVIEQRNGTLWYMGDDKDCWRELHDAGGKAELVPDGKVDCQGNEANNGKAPDSVTMSMTVDSNGQAHISGVIRASFELKGQKKSIEMTYDGVAVRDEPSGK